MVGAFSPPAGSKGTHVSAVAGDGNSTIAAWFGDGLWTFGARGWARLKGDKALSQVRALTVKDDQIAASTYSGSVWWRKRGAWKEFSVETGLHGSVYSLATFRGKVVAGTFENGVSWFDGKHWSRSVSRDHPREMVVFRDRLYVRQSAGKVDRFDGKRWTKDVFPWLPRGAATCLGVGDGRLLVGQFGGWSEFDGSKWTHFLRLGELESYVVTALAAQNGKVWVGTQECGVFVFDSTEHKGTLVDQRQGLGDDWIRRILPDPGGSVLGLFRTGAYIQHGDRFDRLTPNVAGEATGFARRPSTGQLFVGSREGLWRIDSDCARRIAVGGVEAIEVQCLMAVPNGLWIGMPNGAAFAPWPSIS
jgi:hypothetical protein